MTMIHVVSSCILKMCLYQKNITYSSYIQYLVYWVHLAKPNADASEATDLFWVIQSMKLNPHLYLTVSTTIDFMKVRPLNVRYNFSLVWTVNSPYVLYW